jgi:hypothetical protein
MVAKGNSLAEILDSLCRLVEAQPGEVLASILLVDGNHLRHGGGPSLPNEVGNREAEFYLFVHGLSLR